MPVDLHSHSTASDGSETPARVVAMAAEAGLSALALTDHDTLSGIGEARQAADQLGVELIAGVELSLDWTAHYPAGGRPGGMHLIVLFVDDSHGPIQDRLEGLRVGRSARNRLILERLADLGVDISIEEVVAKAGAGTVGRPHIAAALVDRGYAPDIGSAFQLYLGNQGPAYVGRRRLTANDALDLARRSGGVSVLAHPYTLGLEHDRQLENLLAQLAERGLDGVETHHSGIEPDRRKTLRRMASRVGLSPSGGSDYHGTYKPGIEVGVGVGDLAVPDHFLEELRERAGR